MSAPSSTPMSVSRALRLLALAGCWARGAAIGVASAGISWQALYRQLDQLPVFILADEARAPLQFERGGQAVAVFYESCVEAEAALLKAYEAYPELGLRVLPTGLGNALQLAREGGRGVLVPDPADLAAARALAPILDEAAAWGEPGSLPLFGCPSMRKPLDDGRQGVPLFLSLADAQAALAAAAGSDDPASRGLVLECCPLVSMAEQLVLGTVLGPVQFVPSREAARYCNELERRSGPVNKPPGGVSQGAARRAYSSIFTEGRGAGSSGLFPS